jgi:hypothetical protein
MLCSQPKASAFRIQKIGHSVTFGDLTRQIARLKPFEVAAHLVDQPEADLIGRHLVVENPFLRFRDRDHLGEHIVHLDHAPAADRPCNGAGARTGETG